MWDGGGHRYQLEKVVGHGAFGIVWRARTEDSDVVAIKKVMLDRRYHNRELEMMKGLDHECVIKLHHHFEKPCAARLPRRALASPRRRTHRPHHTHTHTHMHVPPPPRHLVCARRPQA